MNLLFIWLHYREMTYVMKRCRQLAPAYSGGHLAVVKAKVRAWHRRDDIEARIVKLREQVQGCYNHFLVCCAMSRIHSPVSTVCHKMSTTARTEITSAQTEYTSIRIENTLLVQGTENQVRLNRLEVLVTDMLLTSKFGQHIVEQVGIQLENVGPLAFTSSIISLTLSPSGHCSSVYRISVSIIAGQEDRGVPRTYLRDKNILRCRMRRKTLRPVHSMLRKWH